MAVEYVLAILQYFSYSQFHWPKFLKFTFVFCFISRQGENEAENMISILIGLYNLVFLRRQKPLFKFCLPNFCRRAQINGACYTALA